MKILPKCASELGTAVHGDVGRNSEARDPDLQEGTAASLRFDVGERFSLGPASVAIHDRQEVLHTVALRQRAYEVEV